MQLSGFDGRPVLMVANQYLACNNYMMENNYLLQFSINLQYFEFYHLQSTGDENDLEFQYDDADNLQAEIAGIA